MEEYVYQLKNNAIATLSQIDSIDDLELLRAQTLGKDGDISLAIKKLHTLPTEERRRVGRVLNEVKRTIEEALQRKRHELSTRTNLDEDWIDTTAPGILPPQGHLHVVTQAIDEITNIFQTIGFTRVRHPEVDWDWYVFESLNMPPQHPARDEWETFFIDWPNKRHSIASLHDDKKRSQIVLTPHTSNGQVREMEKGNLPIRMINIAKCYRRQSDVSHLPMFHQFEGLYIDRNVSISSLKGVLDYFVKQFFGIERRSRIRPFHFQFTEPSFEVDISCGICLGKARLPDGQECKLCKGGWLELGGAGMVHPVVLTSGRVNPRSFGGFAFGLGVERVAMMKSGTKLDDIRLLYSNDVRFLEQF